MAQKNQSNTWTQKAGGIPVWAWGTGLVLIVVFIFLRGNSSNSTSTSQPSSVVNSPLSPTNPVMSTGHTLVPQNLPTGQVTPNEPGTSPIISSNGSYQYGGS